MIVEASLLSTGWIILRLTWGFILLASVSDDAQNVLKQQTCDLKGVKSLNRLLRGFVINDFIHCHKIILAKLRYDFYCNFKIPSYHKNEPVTLLQWIQKFNAKQFYLY